MTSLSVALAGLLVLGPPEGPAPVDRTPARQDHHDQSVRQRLSFDESIGASSTTPIVTGLADAAEDKRERDREIPRQSQNPQVQVMPGARVNSGADDGFELQATITQGWNLEGYGKTRRAAAAAETATLEGAARAQALEQRFGAADAWIRLHGAELRLAAARADLELAEQLVETLERAREAGVVTRLDVAEVRTLAAEAEAAVVELGGEVHDLGLALARETGVTVTSPLGTHGDYPDPALPEEAELKRRFAELERLPAVQLRRLEARAALAEARALARAKGTVLTAGASVQLESTNELLLFGVLGANIAAIDRNQRGRASAHAQARRAEAQADQLAVELSATLATALHELRHTRERVELLRDRTLPALDELIAASSSALELGEGTRAELLLAHHRRNLAARELLIAEADHAWARVQVWLYLEALSAEADAE
ncbi:MAG: TolC family protein [Enhygromyxa sp.]